MRQISSARHAHLWSRGHKSAPRQPGHHEDSAVPVSLLALPAHADFVAGSSTGGGRSVNAKDPASAVLARSEESKVVRNVKQSGPSPFPCAL